MSAGLADRLRARRTVRRLGRAVARDVDRAGRSQAPRRTVKVTCYRKRGRI
jgi:hypothetical protein